MNNKNGDSIIWLIIGVVLIIAIVIFGSRLFKEELKKENDEDIKTQMLQVQAKAKVIFEKYHVDNNNGLKGTQMTQDEMDEKFNATEAEKYYKWNQEILNEIGLSDIQLEEGEYFLVNYETEEVIYSLGLTTKEDETYYKLSEIKELQDKKEEESIEALTN